MERDHHGVGVVDDVWSNSGCTKNLASFAIGRDQNKAVLLSNNFAFSLIIVTIGGCDRVKPSFNCLILVPTKLY